MHNAWKVNSKLQPSDNGVLEHESICKALELAIEYDQLNIGELAAMELLCRRLQMIQYRWKDRVLGSYSSGTVDDESHFFLGVDPTRGNLCICPALNTWLGEELHKEAQANKEQRKAREERLIGSKLHGAPLPLCFILKNVGQRDLLPLRLPTVENGIQGVQTLNHLYGQDEVRSFAPVGPQASSLDGMAHKYRRVGPPPQSRPEEALQALLGSMSVYSLDNIECNVASFDEALVSWPEPGSRPVRIADHLASDSGNLLSLAGASELLAEADALSGKFEHTVGVFFVRKKSGKLRLILDTRKVAEGDVLYTAAGDVADAFHRMELPSCGPEDFVTPEYCTLPMGRTDRIEDRTWTGQVRAGRTIHAQYVDNFFVSGIDSGVVQQSFDRMKCILEDWGFSIHEVTEAQPVVHGLGLVIDGESRSVSLTPARIWKLRLAALALSRRRVPPPAKVIEKVVGHFTFAMMVRRECLSVFSAVYKYIRFKGHSDPSCRPQQAHGLLWRAAQQELVQASSILPLMCTSLDLPWSPVVTATDASEIGYGVCQRHLGCDQVAQVGRSCERWRYAVEGAIKARSNALGTGDDHADDQAQYECARIRDSEFKEVGASVLVVLCSLGLGTFSALKGMLGGIIYCWLITLPWHFLSCTKGGFPLSAIVLIVPLENPGSKDPLRRARMVPATSCKRPRVTAPSAAATEQTLLGAPSLLELNKVRRLATQERYHTTVETFLFWCRGHFSMTQSFDYLLTAYLNELYAQGEDVSAAEYAFAAFRYRFPDYGKHGSKMLPRAIQALEGYRNLAPPQMRLPTPRVAFTAILGCLLVRCKPDMALGLLLQWDLLLRPGELTSLRPHQVVPPAPLAALPKWGVVLAPSESGSRDPSKTNVFDESILLSDRVQFLLPALAALVERHRRQQALFGFTCAQLNAEFKSAAAALKLDELGATLYGNRHGGASELRLRGTPLKEIKARGRWVADSSVKRYEKATVAQLQVHKVLPTIQLYGNFVEHQLLKCSALLKDAVATQNPAAVNLLRQLFLPLPSV
ncbi:unnamed protein product [Symbiodinium necroappetens]|uniref:Uncharacterized protein n=1 Tax=Symbiodinium necroappetens TaxID=1628268 RepID=A0A812XH04_9DINO|nr:unnamed protein product [Symbiodinium necroappetens]